MRQGTRHEKEDSFEELQGFGLAGLRVLAGQWPDGFCEVEGSQLI